MANPLSRRLLRLAGLLSLLLIAVVVNYLLHDGGEVINPIAEAAQRTAAMPGARLRLEVTYSSEGSSRTVTGTGDGDYDGRTGRSDVQMTMALPDGSSLWVEALGDERDIFTRSSSLESLLPPGKLWLGMQPLLGHEPIDGMGGGPGARGILDQLKAGGSDIEEVDHQSVSGHPATRYRTTIDPSREADVAAAEGNRPLAREYEVIAEQIPEPMGVEVWIDGHGLARLIDVTQKLPITPDGKALEVNTRMEFFAFGHKTNIPLPPKRKVFDYTPVLRAELGLEDGHEMGPLVPPAGARPLSASAFRRRARRICRVGLAESRHLLPRSRELTRELRALGPDGLRSVQAKPIIVATGRWYERSAWGLVRRQFRRLSALAPPAASAADYRRWMILNAKGAEWILAEARIYQLGIAKVPGTEDHKAAEHAAERESKRLAGVLGISPCEAKSDGADPDGANPDTEQV